MSLHDLLAAYRQVAAKHDLTGVDLAAVTVQSVDLEDPTSGWAALTDFVPREGWLQFQSYVASFIDGRLPEVDADWGLLLAAEAVDAAGQSLQLRQNGRGGLRLTRITPVPVSGGATAQYLADTVSQLASAKAPGSLVYRRYWSLDPEIGPVPVLAAFQGFEHRKES